uniref:Uncharacterized protein n=1 Tax=Hirondellea gigas TaxID=1518452 RepID=A0A6A7FXF0_9CRUS
MSRVSNILSSDDFETQLNNANSVPKKGIVVHWTASWCGPCREISPAFDEFSQKFPRLVFLRVDVDACKELAQNAEIKSLPTFTFYHGTQQLSNETVTGVKSAELEAAIEKISSLSSPFSGGGRSLTAPSLEDSSASAQPPPRKRFNPWADPTFVPPGMQAPQTTNQVPDEAKSSKEPNSKSPWADPTFQPQQAPSPPNPDEDNELAKALAMSVEMDENENAAQVPNNSENENSSSKGNDPSLVAKINQDMLAQLLGMGFARIRSEKSLILTKGVNLEAAMNWLISNESSADIDEPLQVIGTAKKEDPAKVWGDKERWAPLGHESGVVYGSDEEDDDTKSILKRVSSQKKKYKAAEDTPSKPLTKEEKLKDLEKRRAQRKVDIAKQELETKKTSDRQSRQNTKDVAEMKRKRSEADQQMLLDKKKRELKLAKMRKRKIKEKIRAEKERRKREAEERQRIAEQRKANAN